MLEFEIISDDSSMIVSLVMGAIFGFVDIDECKPSTNKPNGPISGTTKQDCRGASLEYRLLQAYHR